MSGRGEGLKCFRERPGQAEGQVAILTPTTRIHVAEERATSDPRQAAKPRSRSPPILRGRLPFTFPGCLARNSPHSFSRPPPPSRPLRQDASPERLPRRTHGPAPHQSLDEWTRAGRAARALGSARAHPQWLRGRARLRVQLLPGQLRRRQRRWQAEPAALSGTHRQRPPHPQRSETPIGRGASAPRATIGCGWHLGPAPSAEPGSTDRRGQGDEGAGPGVVGGAWGGAAVALQGLNQDGGRGGCCSLCLARDNGKAGMGAERSGSFWQS